MLPGLLTRLRPTGPWRFGPGSGARHETETIGHSDTLYSALCAAMNELGEMESWLAATATAAEPAVRISSLFPFLGRTLYVIPPRSVWPPAASARVRWKAARFISLTMVSDLLAGKPLMEDRWEVDSRSQCLIPAGGVPPFRIATRAAAAVDRLTRGVVEPHYAACIEFNNNAGLWSVAVFSSNEAELRWRGPLEAAFRLLADSGIGGEKTRGWGHAEAPEFQRGEFPRLLLPELRDDAAAGHWLLSLYSPAEGDEVDWSGGFYDLTLRTGLRSKSVRMAVEGSVLRSTGELRGRAIDTAPSDSVHPLWRAGFAVAVPLPQHQETPPAEARAFEVNTPEAAP